MRLLTNDEKKFILQITSHGLDMGLLEITETGLKKSIMDATEPVRQYFAKSQFHDYAIQEQGAQYKILKVCKLLTPSRVIETQMSVYRPETKMGDPRLWIYKLKDHANPSDLIGLIIRDEDILVLNITNLSTKAPDFFQTDTAAFRQLRSAFAARNRVADELLNMIKEVKNKGATRAVCSGDTAIGRTLETHLGISINSSKAPDYKGIEIKSSRKHALSTTLFAQVPNWDISPLKASAEILDNYGYLRRGAFRLNCTVSTQNFNSQGLSLRLEDSEDKSLIEFHKENGTVCIWLMKKLKERLLEKHKETFWVTARTEKIRNIEYFTFTKVEHTINPITLQFELLIGDGGITIDHLIKREFKGARERGPLFKIKKTRLNELFPPSNVYRL